MHAQRGIDHDASDSVLRQLCASTLGVSVVDRAHRELEQLRLKLFGPALPEFEALRECLDAMREHWRVWADAWAEGFSALCQKEGFLPASELRQRSLFDEVVRPLAKEGTTALFVIDAFRYEMGAELREAIAATPATSVSLAGRFAELPTNTEVGMNVLAPVADHGRLTPALKGAKIDGFATGEFRVKDPETRKRAMHSAVGGATCPWLPLAEVVARDAQKLKKTVAQASLVVVHSEEIDKAGEKGVGTALFDTVMQQIRVAWQLLHEAGVRRFVFTADHGFLLLDPRTTVAQAHGRKIDPNRRHVLSAHATDHADEARVAMSDLGYEGVEGWDLMFPRTTAPFDTGRRTRTFVHGGNSLQERVIPVLTVTHRAGTGGSTARYRVEAEALEPVAGMHCLKATVDVAAGQSALGFATSFVVVSDNDLKFYKFDDVYRKVVTELGTASCPRGALGDVLDRWVGAVEDALIDAGEDPDAPDFDEKVQERLDEDLAAKTGGTVPQDFVRVIQTIFRLKQEGDLAEAGALISWLSGSGNVAASGKKAAGIKGDIGSGDALDYLRGVLEIVKAAGYRGLLIVIDEAETIVRMRKDSRHKSLNGIRQIADAAGSYPGLLWLFTGTPEFFDERRGVAGLAPLHDRVRFMKQGRFASLRQPQLELSPFDPARLRSVALRLRELFRDSAKNPDRVEAKVTPELIERLVAEVTKGFKGDVGVVPRQFLRELVNTMDLVDDELEYDPATAWGFSPTDLRPEEQLRLGGGDAPSTADADDEDEIPVEQVW